MRRKIKELFDSPEYSSESLNQKVAEVSLLKGKMILMPLKETDNYFKNCDYNIVVKDFERFKLGVERDLFNDPEKMYRNFYHWILSKQ